MGGIIINGRLIRGAEIGHRRISSEGRCGGGEIGCFEALTSGTILLNKAKDFPDCSASYIQRKAKEGNKKAIDIIKKLGIKIGLGATNIVNILNPNPIILGGGVISGIPDLIPIIEKDVQENAIFPTLVKKARIESGAGIIGAGCIALMKS